MEGREPASTLSGKDIIEMTSTELALHLENKNDRQHSDAELVKERSSRDRVRYVDVEWSRYLWILSQELKKEHNQSVKRKYLIPDERINYL
jgi:hypothetical protein